LSKSFNEGKFSEIIDLYDTYSLTSFLNEIAIGTFS
jgi:hypothetical protein